MDATGGGLHLQDQIRTWRNESRKATVNGKLLVSRVLCDMESLQSMARVTEDWHGGLRQDQQAMAWGWRTGHHKHSH
jgi:hypothetical protein